MLKVERRFVTSDVRMDGEGEARKIRGHAAIFDEEADIWYFKEIIERGAFADAIKGDDVRCLYNHNADLVLGRNRAQTLDLREDDVGLLYECTPPDTDLANHYVESIARGDVSQSSFAFTSLDESWEKKDGILLRRVKRVKLYDVSPVTYPAYEGTDVSARAAGTSKQDLEEILKRGTLAVEDPELFMLQLQQRRLDIEAAIFR